MTAARRCLALLLAAAVAGCADTEIPDPPVPARLDDLDPALAARIRETLDEITRDAGDVEARVRLGMIYGANAQPDAARRCFEQAFALGWDEARTWHHLALVHAERGDLDAAVRCARRAAEGAPDYAPARWQEGLWRLDRGELDEAEEAFTAAAAIDPHSSAARLGLARVRLARSDHAGAATLLEDYLEEPGGNEAYARFLLGSAYRGLGRPDDAEAALREGSAGPPQWADPWRDQLAAFAEGYQAQLERAKARAAAGQLDAAIAILNGLKSHRDVTVEVYNNLGLCYMANERIDLAVEVLEEGLRVNPNSLEVNHLLAGACWLQVGTAEPGQRETLRARALQYVKRALAIDPAYVPALGLHADMLAAGGDLAGAVEAYREAARWEPDNPEWLYSAAMTHGRLREWDRVVECLEQVVERTPAFKDAASRLGLAYVATGRYDDAETMLNRALSLNPDYEEAIRKTLAGLQVMRAGGTPPP